MPNNDIFSNRILTLRNHLRINQLKFADEIGISQGYLAKVESGGRVFSRKVCNRIANKFGVRIVWLETGELPIFDKDIKGSQIAKGRGENNWREKENPPMEELLDMARAVLVERNSRYSRSLAENIRSLFQAITDEKELRHIKEAEKAREDEAEPRPMPRVGEGGG